MDDLATRLRKIHDSDHMRGCMGRQYSCTCGYDDGKDALVAEAAAALARPDGSAQGGSARDLAEELREYTAMKYAGDCKCGKCQLVPRALVERIYHTLNGTSVDPVVATIRRAHELLDAVEAADSRSPAEGVSAIYLINWLETETSVMNCSFVAERLLQKFDVRQKHPSTVRQPNE